MWWHLKWTPDSSLAMHRLSYNDRIIAGVLVSIFGTLCFLMVFINWIESQISKENEKELLQSIIVSLQNNANLQDSRSLSRLNSTDSGGSVEDAENSGSDEDSKPRVPSLRSIPEYPDPHEELEESRLSQSCSQFMLQKPLLTKSKRRTRASSAPTRKKVKSTG